MCWLQRPAPLGCDARLMFGSLNPTARSLSDLRGLVERDAFASSALFEQLRQRGEERFVSVLFTRQQDVEWIKRFIRWIKDELSSLAQLVFSHEDLGHD